MNIHTVRAPSARFRTLAVSIVAIGVLLSGCERSTSDGQRPTIVLIVTDDQRSDTLWAMPTVKRELIAHGVTFRNAFVTTPLCCPSRASILTGRYAHTTGVWQNSGPFGGFRRFRDRSTLATRLHDAGYSTALFGKYLNRYQGTYIPPGWDRWFAIGRAVDPYDLYYRYTVNDDGRLRFFGTNARDHSLNVMTEAAFSYILKSTGPLFVYFAPYTPHTPAKPAPGDRDAFADLPFRPAESYDEQDVSDKPRWVRGLRRLNDAARARLESRYRRVPAALLGLDRAVGALVEALRLTGRLNNSVVVLTSDNGIHLGEHRWTDKGTPYEESIRVPLVVRYDRMIRQPREDRHLVLNIDLAPTLTALGGTRVPGAEGRSLAPLLRAPTASWRSDFLIEQARLFSVPGYCGLRTTRFTYVRYETGEEELYDLTRDPHELENLALDRRFAASVRGFRNRVSTLCRPRPPTGASDAPE
jgi:N-acetylglucosamine-6-sulfatase